MVWTGYKPPIIYKRAHKFHAQDIHHMKLLHNWRAVLKRAWSVRLMILAGILSGMEVVMPYMGALPIPTGIFVLSSFVVTMAALIARIMAQSNLPNGG